MVRGWSVVTVALATACIIPDNDIDVRPPRTNPGAVRIVDSVAVTPQLVEACSEVPISGERPEESQRETCPLPPITVPTGLIRLEGQTLCVCPEGQVDAGGLGAFDIHVEDPDVDREGLPKDDIFGVFLLDVPPNEDAVGDFVAYTSYLDPIEPARLVPLPPGSYLEPIDRPPTNLKAWSLGLDERIDLCNNNDGAKLDQAPADQDPEPSLHSLQLVVTDRPWYVPVEIDEYGAPKRDSDGELVRDGLPHFGVPDLPAGATYDVAHYVFQCSTPDDDSETAVCDCVDAMEES